MKKQNMILEGLQSKRVDEANSKLTNMEGKEVFYITGEYTEGKKPNMEYKKFQLFQVDGKYYEVSNKDYIPNTSNFYSAVGASAKYPKTGVGGDKKVAITKF